MSNRVLVVDRSLVVAEALAELLRADGYEVRTAASVVAGVEVAAGFAPAVVLCELPPAGPGADAILETFGPRTRVVFIADGRAMGTHGAPVHFKPIDIDRLLSVVAGFATPGRPQQAA